MTEPKPLFEPKPGSRRGKVWCRVCHAEGYDGLGRNTWKEPHRRGHWPCRWCGRPLTRLISGKPRIHTRCPLRPQQ